jgi:hypothetical protein
MGVVSIAIAVINIGVFWNAGRSEGDFGTCVGVGTLASVGWLFWPFNAWLGLAVVDALAFAAIAGIRILREKRGQA